MLNLSTALKHHLANSEAVRRRVETRAEGKKMNMDGVRELDEIAAKMESTIRKLPAVKRDELLRTIQRIRAQLTALLSVTCQRL